MSRRWRRTPPNRTATFSPATPPGTRQVARHGRGGDRRRSTTERPDVRSPPPAYTMYCSLKTAADYRARVQVIGDGIGRDSKGNANSCRRHDRRAARHPPEPVPTMLRTAAMGAEAVFQTDAPRARITNALTLTTMGRLPKVLPAID